MRIYSDSRVEFKLSSCFIVWINTNLCWIFWCKNLHFTADGSKYIVCKLCAVFLEHRVQIVFKLPGRLETEGRRYARVNIIRIFCEFKLSFCFVVWIDTNNTATRVELDFISVISCCALLRFLYSQLLDYSNGNQSTVIEPSGSGKLRVKPDVQFHLYISTAPCGDGALFSPRYVIFMIRCSSCHR